MTDMTILAVALAAIICLAAAFFGVFGNNAINGNFPMLSGVSGVKKFYENCMKKPNVKPIVLYINIFYENLQIMVERKELENIREQVEHEVLALCRYGHGEAAQVDGNNYVVVTDLMREDVENFCKNFLHEEKKGFKMIDTYIGVYITSSENNDFMKAAGFAKKASRAAKAAENDYLVADKDSLSRIIKNDNIERNIENFIDNNDFYQMYQPFYYAYTKELAGCEVLTRLKDDTEKNILPGKILNVLEREKLYGKFDMYVFEKCCEWAAKKSEWNLMIACKFAKSTLAHEDVAENIIHIAAKAGIRTDMIVIEAAQDCVEQNDTLKKNILTLKRAGFKFCIDNFGKGYTSLADISVLSPDAIKLDKSLLANNLVGTSKIIFDNVVKLAKEVNTTVLCSGIETEEQMKIAIAAGCDILQGFYFYKPLREDEFDRLLIRSKEENREEIGIC